MWEDEDGNITIFKGKYVKGNISFKMDIFHPLLKKF